MGEIPLAAVKVEELLREVRVDYYGKTRVVESTIKSVRNTLLGLPDREISSSLASAFIRDLGVPNEKATLRFRKPESVEVIGSYATQTVTKPIQNVDLAVRIPKSCFHEKDFLNHRFAAKRILYLSALEGELLKCPEVARVEWSAFSQDARKPILVLHPAADESGATTKFVIRVFPTITTDVFDRSKLGLGRNNVREVKNNEGIALPTPFYNSTIVEDMVVEETSTWLQNALSKCTPLRNAISLSKVWTRQRSMDGYRDGLNGFLVSVLMTHLSTSAGKSRITEHMSPLQAFRVMLDAIGNGDILGKGIYLQQEGNKSSMSDEKKLMKSVFDVVVCDPSGQLNLAHRMTKSALNELKEYALSTMEAMKGVKDGGFDSVFMTPVDFTTKYDYHVRLNTPKTPPSPSTSTICLDQESWNVFDHKVETILSRALGERARLVRVMQRSPPSNWKPSQGLACVGAAPIFVGILLNSIDIALRMADIGPSADNKEEAKKFRSFWGERSELRRFKDGKISETAVWEIEPWKRHVIIEQIVDHVLRRHLSLPAADIKVTAGQLDFALLVRNKDKVSVMPKVLEAFETLSKRLRTMENIPLKIVSVQPLSAVFRHTAVYYPQPHPLAEEGVPQKCTTVLGACLDPLEVVLQLEGSGRWPDDPLAIQKTKSAFCLKIAESMEQLWRTSCVASEDAVDLLMQGFAFRLSIVYDKDPTLLSKERIASSLVTGNNIASKINLDASNLQTVSPKRDLLLRSLHASILHGLHGVYPAYSPTVRLAKRWLASHLLSGSLMEEAVELLVAYLFVRPAPYSPPSSRITGLLRFLQLLISHDWALAPLIVDINGDITAKDEEVIYTHFDEFQQHRRNSSSNGSDNHVERPAMFIATAYDMGSETWTRSSPTHQTLKRLVAYAKSSATLLRQMIRGEGDPTRWQSLFKTSLDTFDVVILLHQESLAHPSRVLFPGVLHSKPLGSKESPEQILSLIPESALKQGLQNARNHLLIGFDPVSEFVDELRMRLGESCNIWYDNVGSDVIGLTMTKPLVFTPDVSFVKRKKVENGGFSHVETLVREIEVIGDGLVRSIHVPERVTKTEPKKKKVRK